MISGTSFLGALALAVLLPLAAEPSAVQKGKNPPPKPKPKSSAPHSTDRPTGTGEPVEPVPEVRSPEQYFDVCDYNGDGVLSFTEAHASLGVDQDGFRVYDVDRDGLISLAEFKARYQTILANGGAFPPPVPKVSGRKPARRTPEELLAQYDKNDDRALDEREIQAALEDYQVRDLPADVALEKLDSDGSKKLELAELAEFANILSPKLDAKRGKKAKSIEELFGKKIPREMRPDSTPIPPRIAGPISPFRRLDLDGNGSISREDLYELQRPLQLSVRINAVFATLDVDNDGVVSESEFWSSMSSPLSAKR